MKHKNVLKSVRCTTSRVNLTLIFFRFYSVEEFWIGGRDDVVEGMWQWASTGRDFTFNNWARGKPNNAHHNEDCVTLDKSYHAKWNDQDCHNLYRYVCEKK